MVMLLFHVGDERYACSCDQIVEIIPQTSLKQVTHSAPYLAGLLRYGSSFIPVVDFSQLRERRASANRLSTRIIIFQEGADLLEKRMLGLLAERVTDIIEESPNAIASQKASFQDAPYLSGVYGDDKGVIQHIDVKELFSLVSQVYSA